MGSNMLNCVLHFLTVNSEEALSNCYIVIFHGMEHIVLLFVTDSHKLVLINC